MRSGVASAADVTLLLIEANPDTASQTLAAIVGHWGESVHPIHCTTGRTALNRLRGEAFDVILAAADPQAYPSVLSAEVSLFIYTVIAFLLVLFVLTRYAWKPIAKLLDERADKIEGQIEEARRIKNLAEERVRERRWHDPHGHSGGAQRR